MRVLFLAHRIPYPPNKGEKIRAFHEVRGLHERGHSVDLLAFADDPQDLQYAEALRRYATTVEVLPLRVSTAKLRALAALTGRTSLSLRYFELAGMHRAIRRRVQENPPQAVVVYSSTMAQYVPIALRARTVADLVDVDSAKWGEYSGRAPFPMSAVYATEATRLRAYEESLTGYFPHVVLTTPREVALLGHSRGAHVHALATGIDLSYFTPASPDSSAGGQTRIVFTGAMDYFANVDGACWFADEVLPRLRDIRDLKFTIVGHRPTRAVRALGSRPAVEVLGSVPDVRPHLHAAAAVLAPLRIARGMQTKVLEGMASARPVIVTRAVAECMPAMETAGAVLVADDADSYARAIRRVLTDASFADNLRWSGRRYVEREHQWPAMLERFCGLVESVGLDHPERKVAGSQLATS